jgi:hypothetical protein
MRKQFMGLGGEPKAGISAYLVVPAAAGVELAAGGPDELDEAAFVGAMDVLIRGQF